MSIRERLGAGIVINIDEEASGVRIGLAFITPAVLLYPPVMTVASMSHFMGERVVAGDGGLPSVEDDDAAGQK